MNEEIDNPFGLETTKVKFRWWYKGRTPAGITMAFKGTVLAFSAGHACDLVENDLRAQYPDMRWMQGREIEDKQVKFGPTVQKVLR